MSNATRELVMSLTAGSSPRQLALMARRQREIGDLARHIVAVDGSSETYRAAGLQTVSLDRSWIERRHRERIENYNAQSTLVPGNGDLFFLDACRQIRHIDYHRLWMIEDDVEWSGHWGDFLTRYDTFEGDLLGTNLRSYDQSTDWYWWRTFAPPDRIPREKWLVAFYPTRRLSRAFVDVLLQDDLASWKGHFECAWPTAAAAAGFKVRDLAEVDGPPVYSNTNIGWMTPGTYVYRPARTHGLFHEDPAMYESPNMLYHPVKIQTTT